MSFAPTNAEPSATATRTTSIATIDRAALASDLFLASFWFISRSSRVTDDCTELLGDNRDCKPVAMIILLSDMMVAHVELLYSGCLNEFTSNSSMVYPEKPRGMTNVASAPSRQT